MKIGFLLGNAEISGGTYVIYEHATRLLRFGHDVYIITQHEVAQEQYSWHSSAGQLQWLICKEAELLCFDIIIATWWQSPFLLKDLKATHYVYFVQSIETRFFGNLDGKDHASQDHKTWKDICEQTYSFNIPMITEALWIQQYIYKNYNNTPFLVRNGIRKDIYSEAGQTIAPRKEGTLRVLVEGPVDVEYKNVPTTIELALQAQADEIWLLTSSDISKFPGVDRVFSRIPILETPEIYRSCDVLVKLSYIEGMFGPPLEMFHCGGTAIVYDVTGHDEYIEHDKNSFVVSQDDEKSVVSYLKRLKNEPDTLARLKNGAQKTAVEWPDWQACATEFENALVTIAAFRPTSKAYLTKYTESIFENAKNEVDAGVLKTFSDRERGITTGERAEEGNFAGIYWHDKQGQFSTKTSKWNYFKSDIWEEVSFEVAVDRLPFWVRIDPSTRVGIINLQSISVVNLGTGKTILTFQNSQDFAKLYLWGTACWIDESRKDLVLAYGSGPRFNLPAIEEDNVTVGDRLRVILRLKEQSIQKFLKSKDVYIRSGSIKSEIAQLFSTLKQRVA